MLKTGFILFLAAAVCAYNLLGPDKPENTNHDYCREGNIPGVPGVSKSDKYLLDILTNSFLVLCDYYSDIGVGPQHLPLVVDGTHTGVSACD